MRRTVWMFLFAGVFAIVTACAGGTGQPPGPWGAGLGADMPYRVGPLQIWIVPEPEAAFLCGSRTHVGPGQLMLGCYAPERKTIVSPPNVYVLLHELKHHFEGAWHE